MEARDTQGAGAMRAQNTVSWTRRFLSVFLPPEGDVFADTPKWPKWNLAKVEPAREVTECGQRRTWPKWSAPARARDRTVNVSDLLSTPTHQRARHLARCGQRMEGPSARTLTQGHCNSRTIYLTQASIRAACVGLFPFLFAAHICSGHALHS